MISDILGHRMGCFLFQLPPSYRYTKATSWNSGTPVGGMKKYSPFHRAGIIFCSCSGPRLPDELVKTADEIYVRQHGPKRWYRHELLEGRARDMGGPGQRRETRVGLFQ